MTTHTRSRSKSRYRVKAAALAVLILATVILSSVASAQPEPLPWREAGLTRRQAAAHLLNRFTYGPRPGEIRRVIDMGMRNWFEDQLHGDAPSIELTARLAALPTTAMDDAELLQRFPFHDMSISDAIEAAGVNRAEFLGDRGAEMQSTARTAVWDYMTEHGYVTPARILEELGAQKLYRALYSDSQLVEVLTDFWFNHFNISATKSQPYASNYERDAIRPNVLGSFRTLLGATARHPAMLAYLDNSISQAEPDRTTTFDVKASGFEDFSPTGDPTSRARLLRALKWRPEEFRTPRKPEAGLNENYARELMELHTLGVDGGYTQQDVIEVARALTGWTHLPRGKSSAEIREILEEAVAEPELGFVIDREFLFRADFHDAESKRVLGIRLPEGRGIEDGEEVLDILAIHPSTARHISYKLAVRFVSENPPPKLVARMAQTFDLSGGDLREVLRTMVNSPEFWQKDVLFNKLKSPFELVVSALRILDAEVTDHLALNRWTFVAGQPLYLYNAPTGYPDREHTWLSPGTILVRLNFTQVIARAEVAGVNIDMLKLAGRKEPRSMTEAIRVFAPKLLPGRSLGPVLTEALNAEPEPKVVWPANAAARRRLEVALRQRALVHSKNGVAALLSSPEFQYR